MQMLMVLYAKDKTGKNRRFEIIRKGVALPLTNADIHARSSFYAPNNIIRQKI